MDTFALILAIVALIFFSSFLGYGIADSVNRAYCREGKPRVIENKIYTCKEVTWQNQ